MESKYVRGKLMKGLEDGRLIHLFIKYLLSAFNIRGSVLVLGVHYEQF